jgi:DNA-binding LytR/AlgR family response regulator
MDGRSDSPDGLCAGQWTSAARHASAGNSDDCGPRGLVESTVSTIHRAAMTVRARSVSCEGTSGDHGLVQRVTRMPKPQPQAANGRPPRLDRIPIRYRNEVVLVPVPHIASVVAEGENLHIVTTDNERHTINYRLKDLETRLDPARFVRLGRGVLVNIDMIKKVVMRPGGRQTAILANGQELPISRIQTRAIRDRLLTL